MNKRFQLIIKQCSDVAASIILIIMLSPVWVVVAILIKLTSPGPVFFIQDRPGQHKRIFRIYKFRSMKVGSEKMIKGQEVMKNDERITSVGRVLRRTKIDEIPQLINVIKGEMSIVGPRPERMASLEDYDSEIVKRLNMKPGMTGLAQVSGNIYLDLQNRYKFDIYYVEHFSLWLDFKIILRTFGVVLFGEERYIDRPLIDMGCNIVTKQKGVI